MSLSGRQCEYASQGVNGSSCGKAEVHLKSGNVRCWPNPEVQKQSDVVARRLAKVRSCPEPGHSAHHPAILNPDTGPARQDFRISPSPPAPFTALRASNAAPTIAPTEEPFFLPYESTITKTLSAYSHAIPNQFNDLSQATFVLLILCALASSLKRFPCQ